MSTPKHNRALEAMQQAAHGAVSFEQVIKEMAKAETPVLMPDPIPADDGMWSGDGLKIGHEWIICVARGAVCILAADNTSDVGMARLTADQTLELITALVSAHRDLVTYGQE